MVWDQRHRYFYRNVWAEGRSVRRYMGCGAVAELAATLHAQEQVRKELGAREWKATQEQVAQAVDLLRELCRGSDILARASLMAQGFHNPTRGRWRKRRARDQPQGP